MQSEAGVVRGIVLIDSGGRVSGGLGLGRDARVAALAGDTEWMTETRASRLRELRLDNRGYALLRVAARPEGEALLIFDAPDPLLDLIGSVDIAYDVLQHLVGDPFEAMTVVDASGRLVYMSDVHRNFFGLARGEGLGRPVGEVIENTRLDRVVTSGKAEIGVVQRMRGIDRVVTRIPLRRDEEVVGALGRVMFKGPQQAHEMSKRLSDLHSQVEFYQKEAATLRRQTYGLDAIIGDSAAVRKLRLEIGKLAPLDTSILLLGESGTGKELVAHALHMLSPRREKAMVTLNTAAMPASLVEAELFGYVPGAFTGADRKGHKGKFEQADGGTIFLDEIGDVPVEVQPKLLRILQNRTVERIGGDRSKQLDFRMICATNADLPAQVDAGKFRLDLYYRISVVTLELPPLRARPDDIPLLVEHFLRDLANRHNRPMPEVTAAALDWLMEQSWPGNVRQLRHEIERAFVFCDTGRIEADDFAGRQADRGIESPARGGAQLRHGAGETLKEAVERIEDEMIAEAMTRQSGNKKKVAEELGISRSYLYKKLEERGL